MNFIIFHKYYCFFLPGNHKSFSKLWHLILETVIKMTLINTHECTTLHKWGNLLVILWLITWLRLLSICHLTCHHLCHHFLIRFFGYDDRLDGDSSDLILEHVSSTIIIMMQHHFVMQAPGNYYVVEIIMKISLSS